MKVVLDTNVFISAFFWKGSPRQVLERCIEGIDDLYTSREILAELHVVLCRPKFSLDGSQIEYFIKSIEDIARIVPGNLGAEKVCRDEDDQKVLECALSGNTDFIITGDHDLLVLKEFRTIAISTPTGYLTYLAETAG